MRDSEPDGITELTEEQLAFLADLPSERRHELLDWWHARRAALVALREDGKRFADRLDELVGEMQAELGDQPSEEAKESFTDLLTGLALIAESGRAFARDDVDSAVELSSVAGDYMRRAGEE
ncbi:hypothetical protein [Crossiella sp. CA198]|uniref:hypothetical protein n=1 Tax=Crossiella sp. CA198 TaxID=3455607 RepID=UPI003F8D2B07